MTLPPLHRFAPVAWKALVGAILFLGMLHVVFGARLVRMLPTWPAEPPGRPFWALGMGLAMVALAGAILWRRRPRDAAVLLGAVLLLPVLALHLPRSLPTGEFGDAWLNVLKWLAMATAPFVAASFLPVNRQVPWRERTIDAVAAVAPWLLAAFMIGSAILHVRFAEFVAQLMQPWMPWRLFWTYFAAGALATGGIGLVIPRTARLAALMTSLMIFLWFFLVHTPRMLADPTGPVGWSEMGEALAFAALAFLLAALPSQRSHHSGA